MAIWQFNLVIAPRKAAERFASSSALVSPAVLQQAWWLDVESASSFVQRLAEVAPEIRAWSQSIRWWGTAEDGNRIDVSYEGEQVATISFRCDMRSFVAETPDGQALLRALCDVV